MVVIYPFATTNPRGRAGYELEKQTRFIQDSGVWVTEKNEDGNDHKVYLGPKGTLGLPLVGDVDKAVRDKNGAVITYDTNVRSLYDLIFQQTSAHDDKPALARCVKGHTFKDATLPDGKPNPKPSVVDVPGEWSALSFAEVKAEARAFGMCLREEHKVEPKQKMAIWAGNSVEWVLADLACAVYNWTSVSVYDTLGPNAASYIIADSGSQVLVCEEKTFKQVPKVMEDETYTSNPARDLQIVVCIGKADAESKAKLEGKGVKVLSFGECVAAYKDKLGNQQDDGHAGPEDIATIMYTSGTTGMPKGVMLKHSNIVSIISMTVLNPSLLLVPSDVHLSYLPLAHIFERSNCLAFLARGAVVNFASNGAKGLLADLGVIRPTVFAGVPKVYENIRDAVMRKMVGVKKRLFDKALAAKSADLETGCGYCPIWDTLVFNKTKEALGGRVRLCVSGGAPISKDTLLFVACAFGPIIQGYGATETSAASTLTMSFDLSLGHVGPSLGSSYIRLVDVPDMNYFNASAENYEGKAKAAFENKKNKSGGEVWIGGPGVSPGYYDPSVHGLKPGVATNGMSVKSKEEFFEEDGWNWFKTGDIGTWTESGCLKIVDRRKNMFKTSLGEYVPVEEVEKTYQDNCGYADFVFLPKETKVHYVGLVVVVSESIGAVKRWAAENNVQGDEAAIVASKEFHKLLFDEFNAAAKAKKLQRFMWIQDVKNIHAVFLAPGYQEEWVSGVVCPNGHTEQLLTATFKARRAQLDQYFAPHFPQMYPDRPKDHILP